MRPLGVIGHLSRDKVAGATPRIGGGPWYAGRALRALGDDAVLFAKCGDADRAQWQRSLSAIGLPASLSTGGETTAAEVGRRAGAALAAPKPEFSIRTSTAISGL